MRKLRIFIKTLTVVSLALSIGVFGAIAVLQNKICENYKLQKGEALKLNSILPITAKYKGSKESISNTHNVGDSFDVDLKLFGVIPFSSTTVEVVDEMYVAVLGNPFGMKIYTDGVLVIELSNVLSEGKTKNPAKKAGLEVGDYIKKANGVQITTNEDLSEVVMNSAGAQIELEVLRNKKTIFLKLNPVKSDEDGLFHAGVWVRDSSAGIGTLTFYSPLTNIVCGLGHGICDTDTGELLELMSGELVEASIVSIVKGANGSPGELKGKFTYNILSNIALNNQDGVYGILKSGLSGATLTEVALKQEVKDGAAQILCTVDGNTPKLYSCEISLRTANYRQPTQNLVVKITDKELLSKTGGIVQGMSGSPILQNGKLVGALTHVLVDDCTKGYGIFAENMLETAQSVANNVGDGASTSRLKDVS